MSPIRILLVSSTLYLLMMSACASKKNTPDNQLLGVPPTEKEDPFFFVTLPANAEKAAAQGTIGDSPDEISNPNIPTEPAQCFSCVQICAKKGGCEKSDSVCGWGVHWEKEIAMERAQGECDGALNIARYDPQWKRIDGTCPVATCK